MTARNVKRKNVCIPVAAAIGAILFVCIYGVHVLNPLEVDWLLSGGDRSQHYLGWVAYRNSQWYFPVGLTDQLSYPLKTSIIFTDSIPLMAVFFKILSPLLPEHFQYFGLWGLLCFALNGAFSAGILQKYMKTEHQVILGSIFYILSFQMIQRMFMHTALAGHWLILWAICLLVYRDRTGYHTRLLSWLALGAVCSAVHLYLLLMCGIILLGTVLTEVLEQRKDNIVVRVLKPGGYIVAFIGASLLVVALLGGFSSGISAANGGLGAYSLNLNGFINPQSHGRLLRTLSQLDTQYEGFSYLGAGILFLLLCTLTELILHFDRKRIKQINPLILGGGLALGIAFVLAVSPTVSLGNRVIRHFTLPSFIVNVWSIFRASGRIAWVCIYLLFLFALCADYRVVSSRRKSVVLVIALLLQLTDISGYAAEKHQLWSNRICYQPNLNQETWNILLEEGKTEHIVIMDSFEQEQHYDLAVWAMENHITVNRFYFARSQEEEILAEQNRSLEEAAADTVFVWRKETFVPDADAAMHYYEMDDRFVVGYAGEILGLSDWKEE